MLSLLHPCHDTLFAPAALLHAQDLLLARVAHGLLSSPHFCLDENDAGYSLESELPGTKPSEVHVSVKGLELIIKAKLSDVNGLRSHFERRLTLPNDADAGKAIASCENGILRIEVPKKEPAATFEIGLVEFDELPPSNCEGDDQPQYRETIAAPGVAPADLKITCSCSDIEIVGQTAVRGKVYGIQRRYSLPRDADVAGSTAALAHGILTLVVPKRAQPEADLTLLPVGDGAGAGEAEEDFQMC